MLFFLDNECVSLLLQLLLVLELPTCIIALTEPLFFYITSGHCTQKRIQGHTELLVPWLSISADISSGFISLRLLHFFATWIYDHGLLCLLHNLTYVYLSSY